LNEGVSIRLYTPGVGEEREIVRLLEQAFEEWPRLDMVGSSLDYWRWKHLDNPLGVGTLVLGTSGDGIIGCIHTLPQKFKIWDRVIRGGQGVDAGVNPGVRRRGIFRKLADSRLDFLGKGTHLFDWVIPGNPVVIKIFSESYSPFPHSIRNLVRIQDINRQLRMIPMKNPWLMKLGFHVVKHISDFTSVSWRHKPIRGEVKVSEVNYFDDNIDVFWEEIEDHHDFIVERRRDYLNWRFCDPRIGGFVIKIAEDHGRIVGYCVLRINRYRSEYPVGYIVDLLALPDRHDVVDALVGEAIEYFDGESVNIVNCMVVKNHSYEAIFKRHGFLDSRVKIQILYRYFGDDNPVGGLGRSPAERIHVSWGDFDVLPNQSREGGSWDLFKGHIYVLKGIQSKS
jgi:hypothetical protein